MFVTEIIPLTLKVNIVLLSIKGEQFQVGRSLGSDCFAFPNL